ncbi:MAG: hypothetical protein QM758_02305 [Armatimonas sp.]
MSEVMETKPPQAPRMIAVRRRSRRRRTRIAPIDWRRIAVLGVVLLCVLMLVLDRKLGGNVRILLNNIQVALGGLRLEVIALALCGVVWLCLTPGVEDRITRFFKNHIEVRRRRVGRTRGRRR